MTLQLLQCSSNWNPCLVVAVLCDVTKASHTLDVVFFVRDVRESADLLLYTHSYSLIFVAHFKRSRCSML